MHRHCSFYSTTIPYSVPGQGSKLAPVALWLWGGYLPAGAKKPSGYGTHLLTGTEIHLATAGRSTWHCTSPQICHYIYDAHQWENISASLLPLHCHSITSRPTHMNCTRAKNILQLHSYGFQFSARKWHPSNQLHVHCMCVYIRVCKHVLCMSVHRVSSQTVTSP